MDETWLQNAIREMQGSLGSLHDKVNNAVTGVERLTVSVETLVKEVDKLKENMGDHREEITLVKASISYLKERIETSEKGIWEEIEKLWRWGHERLAERKRDCETHHDQIDEAIVTSKGDAVKDVKIWIYTGIIAAIILSIGAATAIIKTMYDVENIKKTMEVNGNGYYRDEEDRDERRDYRRDGDQRKGDVLHAGGSGTSER